MPREGTPAPAPLLPQLLLMERKLQEVHPLLTLCGQIVENWQGNPIQKESLRVFFLVLQVTHYLDAGQVCSASPWGAQAGAPAVLSQRTPYSGFRSSAYPVMRWHECCDPAGRAHSEDGLPSWQA